MTEEIKVIPTNGTSADDVKYAKRVEEIYVDGVNVAGRNAYKKGHCLDKTAILLCESNKCSNYKDCYYKQLKHLEQENKQIKSALEEIRSAIIEYLPKKQGDYNFSKSLNPAEYALLEYIQLQINEVLK